MTACTAPSQTGVTYLDEAVSAGSSHKPAQQSYAGVQMNTASSSTAVKRAAEVEGSRGKQTVVSAEATGPVSESMRASKYAL